MTLGFAAAAWKEGAEPIVGVAADTRISAGTSILTDVGVKTYELGGRCALAASGHALPPMMAAELTRSIVENHNRRNAEKPVGFVDTTRLFGFFLKRTADEQRASCHVAVAGFLSTGQPCLASVVATPGFNRVAFNKIERGGTSVIPVGDPKAARLLLEAMTTAKQDSRPVIGSALAMLFYIAQLEGAFQTVGGGISLGSCGANAAHFSWPIIEISGKRFLRGMNVTEHYHASWPKPEVLAYDEAWCVSEDQRVSALPEASSEPSEDLGRVILPSIHLDEISAETLFSTHDDSL